MTKSNDTTPAAEQPAEPVVHQVTNVPADEQPHAPAQADPSDNGIPETHPQPQVGNWGTYPAGTGESLQFPVAEPVTVEGE